MKRTESIAPPAMGASALLVIFAVLCLMVFSLLCLRTAAAEQRLSVTTADAVAAYYQADLQAQTCFARLRAGETVPGIEISGNRYCFSCPVSETQTLEVELEQTPDGWIIRRWQTVAHPEVHSQTLPVWSGT